MNEDIFSGKWHQFKGKVKEKWGKLTDNDLVKINGQREQLLGSLEERYGWQRQRAEEELKKFEKSFHSHSSKHENFTDYNAREDVYKGEDNDDEDQHNSRRRKLG